ncbi:hypothetical protein Cch01nite_09300 [Cellulomonas chitinilytica]|uniref:Uncharacterized protein n=1 Tax=Cellulomonas chitinilytica TaxID=398759 RepID=A0A919P200_9CELL|nr:hypothetical protein [Cellulomonas chitinilytica]GIG20206.1 hypothetical protein Cch01nite_09300 [Cellulomonas chitinilytica]
MAGFARWLHVQATVFKEAWDGGSEEYALAFYRRRPHAQTYLFYWSLQVALLTAPVAATIYALNGMGQRWTAAVLGACLAVPSLMSSLVAAVKPLVLRRHRRALRRFGGAELPALDARQWRRVWRRCAEVGRRRLRRARWVITLCAVAAVVELTGYPAAFGLSLPWLPYVAAAVCLVLVVRALRRRPSEPTADVELVRATPLRRRFDAVDGAAARLGGVEVAAVDLQVHERVRLGPRGPEVDSPVVLAEVHSGHAAGGFRVDEVTKVVTMRLWLALDDGPQWMVCVGDRVVGPLGLWV